LNLIFHDFKYKQLFFTIGLRSLLDISEANIFIKIHAVKCCFIPSSHPAGRQNTIHSLQTIEL